MSTKPEIPAVPPAFRTLPQDASSDQLLHALHEMAAVYGAIAAGYNHELPELRKLFERMEDDYRRLDAIVQHQGLGLARMQGDLRDHDERLVRLEVGHVSKKTGRSESLPPMRAAADSYSAILDHASQEIATKVDKEVKDPGTPSIPPPEKVAAISKEVMAAAVVQVKAAQLDRIQAAEDENTKLKRNARWGFVAAAGVALLTVLERLAEALLQHHP